MKRKLLGVITPEGTILVASLVFLLLVIVLTIFWVARQITSAESDSSSGVVTLDATNDRNQYGIREVEVHLSTGETVRCLVSLGTGGRAMSCDWDEAFSRSSG